MVRKCSKTPRKTITTIIAAEGINRSIAVAPLNTFPINQPSKAKRATPNPEESNPMIIE